MGVKVESLNVSKERLAQFQAEAEKLLEQGFKETQLQQYFADKYLCGVSVTYRNNNVIYNLHSMNV